MNVSNCKPSPENAQEPEPVKWWEHQDWSSADLYNCYSYVLTNFTLLTPVELIAEMSDFGFSETYPDKLRAVVRCALNTPELREDFIQSLYWDEWLTHIGPAELAEMCGITETDYMALIQPIEADNECAHCGCSFHRTYTEHAQFEREYCIAWVDEDGDEDYIYGVLCDECMAERERIDKFLAEKVLREMRYADYLRTEHWQTVRKGALERARGRCQICNSPKHLHVHHRTYRNRGNEQAEDVIVLCARCHQLFHENGKLEVY